MTIGPKVVNGGESGYHIGEVKRWAAIGGTILTLIAGTGGVMGMKLFSQADVDRAVAHSNQHLDAESRMAGVEGKVEFLDHDFDEKLDRLEDLIKDLEITSAILLDRADGN